jgi:hypothetical protein
VVRQPIREELPARNAGGSPDGLKMNYTRIRFMTDELTQMAMTTWAAKDLPARLLAAQVAKLLNCTPEDVTVLVSAGKLRPLGRSNANAVKFFSAVELMALLADREWLDDATKTIGQFWKRKNARRNGLILKRELHFQ